MDPFGDRLHFGIECLGVPKSDPCFGNCPDEAKIGFGVRGFRDLSFGVLRLGLLGSGFRALGFGVFWFRILRFAIY